MQIQNFTILRDGPPFIMAEIGVNHDGDVAIGRQLVHAAHHARCDAVKFQLFRANLLLSRQAELVEYQKSAAASAEELLAALELSEEHMATLIAEAHALGMAAVVTPFSVPLVATCVRMKPDALKLASPDLVNRPLVEAAAATGLPLILSTGQATIEEITRTLEWLGNATDRTIFLHCVSSYPTPADQATLGAITAMRQAWPHMRIGYSDHTTDTVTGALAVAAGACLLEKHLTLGKSRKGPDHAASLEPLEMTQYAWHARQAFAMRGPFEKRPNAIELEVRQQSRQSVCMVRDLPSGTILDATMLTVKRPGTGVPAAEFSSVLGRRLIKPVQANSTLQWSDLETPKNSERTENQTEI